jgi:hypothetical protein
MRILSVVRPQSGVYLIGQSAALARCLAATAFAAPANRTTSCVGQSRLLASRSIVAFAFLRWRRKHVIIAAVTPYPARAGGVRMHATAMLCWKALVLCSLHSALAPSMVPFPQPASDSCNLFCSKLAPQVLSLCCDTTDLGCALLSCSLSSHGLLPDGSMAARLCCCHGPPI